MSVPFFSYILFSLILGSSTIGLLNNIPAAWLCERGEVWSIVRKKFSRWPWSALCSVGLCAASYFLWRSYPPLPFAAGKTVSALALDMRGESIGEWTFLVAAVVLIWLLSIAAVLDLRFLVLPDQLQIGVAAVGLLFVFVDLYFFSTGTVGVNGGIVLFPVFHTTWTSPVFGALIGGGSSCLTGMISSTVIGQDALGGGDMKLFAALGFAFGADGAVFLLLSSALLAGLFMGIQFLIGRAARGDQKAMGPYIAASGVIWLFFSPELSTF